MPNVWYLIAETVADAIEDRRERRERGPRIRERPDTFSGERIGNAMVGLPTVHDDLTDRGIRHGVYNLVGRGFFDKLFLGTVMALALGLFVHASGIFPWVGTSVFHNGPAKLLPDHHSEFGLNTIFAVKGQRLIIDYDSAIRKGSSANRVVIAKLEGGGLPQGLSHAVVVAEGPGRLSIPVEKTGFLIVRTPKWGKARADRRDAMLDSASVKWGLMWRDPGGDYRTLPMADIASTQVDWGSSAH
ncbi:MAG: hypothetical protein IBJ13_05915 [Sphingopyxis sp.]|nr:hypothetical protein [Sphingopyxis sp.]